MHKNLEKPLISSFLRAKMLHAANLAMAMLLPESKCCYASSSIKQALSNQVPEIAEFAEKHSFFSPYHPLLGKVTSKEQDIWLVADLIKTIFDKVPENQRALMTNEVLSKILAFRTLREGMQLLIPSGEHLVTYTVDKIIFLEKEMPSFGLIPETSHAPSILLFRGTELSWKGRKSIVSDLDPHGVGYTRFMKASPKISRWLSSVSNPQVLGYSLGGILAAYALLVHSDLVESAISFGSPGFFAKMHEAWKDKNLDERLKVYVTRGDCVPKYGHLPGTVREFSLPIRLRPITAHTLFVTAQPQYFLA